MAIDTQWFMRKIEMSSYGSGRRLALKMVNRQGKTMDQASLVRMLNGERDMSLHEAIQLSELLNVPLSEIAERALGQRVRKP
jgi:hypothetical protein